MITENLFVHTAKENDLNRILSFSEDALIEESGKSLNLSHLLVAEEDGRFIGYLEFDFFLDRIPLMQKIYIRGDCRGKGYTTALIQQWEVKMRDQGYGSTLLTASTISSAQHFYHLMGYREIGSIMPVGEPLLMFFKKTL